MGTRNKKKSPKQNSLGNWSQLKSLIWGKPNQKSAGSAQRKKAKTFKASNKPSLADKMGIGSRYK